MIKTVDQTKLINNIIIISIFKMLQQKPLKLYYYFKGICDN